MKRSIEELDFKKAFRPMPQDCRDALMQAARSVKEDEPVKRASYRAALIAALIVMATIAAAIAAVKLGVVDYFNEYYGVAVPKAAQERLEQTEPVAYQVGPMTFTFEQLLTDKRLAISSAHARMTDGGAALYAADSDVYDAVNARDDAVLNLYGLERDITWLDAAKQLGLPLYGVRALIEVDAPYAGDGGAMEDAMWHEDGSIVYLNMPLLNAASIADTLPLTLYMSVMKFDPVTGEVTEQWRRREPLELPVLPLIAERTYLPAGDGTFRNITAAYDVEGELPEHLTVESVHAEQYATGIYLTANVVFPDGISKEQAASVMHGTLSILDGAGGALPDGMNLSIGSDVEELPKATLEIMTSLEKLPDALTVTDGETMLKME